MASTDALGVVDDAAVAADLATRSGELLLQLRTQFGDDPGALRHAGDNRSQDLLAAALADLRPADAVLSEEAEDDAARLNADRVWIIDPLDGTREYGEPGRDDWAVHVALWERSAGGVLTAGAVALPAQGQTLATNGALPSRSPAPGRPRLVVSRTRAPAFVRAVAARLDGELVPMGSAGAKAMAVVQGRADVYVHAGGMHDWDAAAPAVVAAAAGLRVCRFDGQPLAFNTPEALVTELVICVPELADRVLDAVAAER